MRDLNGIRTRIDHVDDHIIKLLQERVMLAQEAARIKNQTQAPLTDEAREEAVMQRLLAQCNEPLLKKWIPKIYTSIFALSKEVRARISKDTP
ncbi:MAG TPA: chorismate mutase [Candidatus Woesebacteria bacterium]|nr:chorismate mutase [Candidatus Woesebacteria bacterium]HNS94375.1 chorismate mutase [Candidatus Woesebacteria bacterium]